MLVSVEFVIGLNGSTMGCLISFIFPALMFLKVIPTPSGGQTQAKVSGSPLCITKQ